MCADKHDRPSESAVAGDHDADSGSVPPDNRPTTAGAGARERAGKLNELRHRLQEVSDLKAASQVLTWDQAIYMPPGGAVARGRQASRLAALAHRKAIDPDTGRLLQELTPLVSELPDDHVDAALVRVASRDFERASREPEDYVARVAEHGSAAYQAWVLARPANDFDSMLPHLQRGIDLAREYASFFPESVHVMDPHIGPDEGFSTSEIRSLFASLRERLVPLAETILAEQPADDSCLRLTYPADQQLQFPTRVAVDLGYDLRRGRIDLSPHPFCTSFARDDVRITTRVKLNDLSDALFSTIHEVGHALYEMGIDSDLDGTPLGHGASAGVHESQSRLWENIIARSRPFWEHYYPMLQATFPGQLRRVSLDTFHRAVNKVQRTFIRTDADEVTYNLHVMVRFELEADLLEGRLEAKDLPRAWQERHQEMIGVVANNHSDGILQDVHWFCGAVGANFQSYTIGNILAAQLYETAVAERPEIADGIGRGQFGTLRSWLGERVHRHGRKFTGRELVRRSLGTDLSIEPYMRYLENKYADLYRLGPPYSETSAIGFDGGEHR